jgi:hypothetical protein
VVVTDSERLLKVLNLWQVFASLKPLAIIVGKGMSVSLMPALVSTSSGTSAAALDQLPLVVYT